MAMPKVDLLRARSQVEVQRGMIGLCTVTWVQAWAPAVLKETA